MVLYLLQCVLTHLCADSILLFLHGDQHLTASAPEGQTGEACLGPLARAEWILDYLTNDHPGNED